MLEVFGEQVQAVLGVESDQGSALGTGLRTLIIYAATLTLVRLGRKRFLSKASAFDVIVAIMFGSIMSRGSDGSTPLVPTLVAGAVLVGLHGLFATLAYMERNGKISIVPYPREPQVINVSVEEGVQIVRIELQ
ncbi:MAG: hypothetical protein ACM3VT_02030 [Solirubrobacterales bacterium]